MLPMFSFADNNQTCSTFSIWESQTKQSFKTRHVDFQTQIEELISDLSTGRPYAFAMIQEKVGKAPEQGKAEWLLKLVELSTLFTKTRADMVPADEESADLIEQVKESLGFEDEIVPATPVSALHEAGFAAGFAMTNRDGKRWPLYALGIPQVASVFQGFDHFVLLHEFGHFSHGDTNPIEIDSRQQNLKTWLDSAEVRSDIDGVARCSQLASAFIRPDSAIGQRIVAGLEKRKAAGHHSCLGSSSDPYQAKERRADLFALRHLLAANKVTAIVETIDRWSQGEAIRPCESGEHPPEFERALYMAGFLIDNEIDVNQLFAQWQRSATCDARSSVGHPLSWIRAGDPASLAARQYRQAYRRWLKASLADDYEVWKSEHVGVGGGESSFELHLEKACQKLEVNPLDQRAQRDALFNYNYLRELQGLELRTSFDAIEKRELFEFRFNRWKRGAEKELARLSMREFASHMLESLKEGTVLREDPQSALMGYNYLLHLNGQPLVYSVEFISIEWLNELLR